jgi:hypothetical protein
MGDVGSTSLFYAAQPKISIGGQDDQALSVGILALRIDETTEGLYRCEATFGNWGTTGSETGFVYFDRRTLDFGKAFAVRVGDGDTAAEIFNGKILGIEAHFPATRPPEIVVLAEDRLQDLRMTRRTRTFEDVSDSDVMQQVASSHGLQTDIDVTGPTYKVLAQVNQSDLAFLRERARAIDAEVWIEGSTFKAKARGRRDAGRVTLTYGQGLKEFSVRADLSHQRTALTVSGWDVSSKEAVEFEAAESAIRSELGGKQSGSAALQSAFGARKERIVHMVPFTAQEAQSFAEAKYRTIARRFVTGEALAEGDGRLKIGVKVEIRGVGPLFEGEYYVAGVRHLFDRTHGFRTRFTVERPGIGNGP